MNKYQGINPNDLIILSYVKFNNSKEFYDGQKNQIKNKIIGPLQDLIGELAPFFKKLDANIVVNPQRMISRIRRDTRFTKDKTLYRENIWFCFMRPKSQWEVTPVMWFEISQNDYSYGVGFWGSMPAVMQYYREYIIKYPQKFKNAVEKVLAAGFQVSGESYKKSKPGEIDEQLRDYYQMKDIFFIKYNKNLMDISSHDLVDILLKDYEKAIDMYNCFAEIVDKYVSER